jgi:cysteinyl-tRNA synthetase
LNFTFDGLQAAQMAIDRLRRFKLRLDTDQFPEGANAKMTARTEAAAQAFTAGLDDDLNTAEALAAVFEYARDANIAMDAGEFGAGNRAAAERLVGQFDAIFDVLKPSGADAGADDSAIEAKVAERSAAKKARDFARADNIRDQLLAEGIILEDTKTGVRWKRK